MSTRRRKEHREKVAYKQLATEIRRTFQALHGDIKWNGRCEFCGEWIVRSGVRSVEQLLDAATKEQANE